MKSLNFGIQNVNFYKILLIFLCSCTFLAITNQLAAATYYVTTSGDDNNDGTSEASAWRTIYNAGRTAVAGDTVYIKAGNYGNEHIVIAANGTSNSPVTFEGYKTSPGDISSYDYILGDCNLRSSDMPLLDGFNYETMTGRTGGTAININGHQYIIIKNILIKDYNTGIFGYNISHCTIENVIAVQLGDYSLTEDGSWKYDGKGISLTANNMVIRNCVVSNASAEGISVSGNNNLIENCKAYCNEGVREPNDTAEERLLKRNLAMDYYIHIRGCYNIVNGCYAERDGDLAHTGHGINIKGYVLSDDSTDPDRISQYNIIKDSVSINAASCFAVQRSNVLYNTFENCTAIGTGMGEVPSAGFALSEGTDYNTFKNCYSINTNYAVFFLDSAGSDPDCHYNNVFENCIFSDTIDYCINFDDWQQVATVRKTEFNNCVFYGGCYFFVRDRPSYDTTLTNCIIVNVDDFCIGDPAVSLGYDFIYSAFFNNGFSSATVSGTGNFDANPLFIDATNQNFRLKPSSPCIDAGTSLYATGFDYNYLNRPRGAGYDIGAYEHTGDIIAYLKFNNGIANDEINNIPPGVKYGTTICQDGIYSEALSFNGNGDYIDFGLPSDLDLTGDRTISAWIKPDVNGDYNTIVAKNIWKYSLFVYSGYLRAYVAGSTVNASSVSSTALITPDEWQHVAMTFDYEGDKKIRLYVNGKEVAYSTQTAMVGSPVTTSMYKFTIGSDYLSRYYFNGAIDEVKVFGRALSSQDISNEYYGIFFADLNEGMGNTIDDALLKNNGTIHGASWVKGISGRALNFNGNGDYIDFGLPSDLDLTGDRTISAWIKPDVNGDYNTIVAKNIWKYSLFVYNGHLRGYIAGSISPASSVSSTALIIPGKWQHVAMTFDYEGDKKIRLYVNGQEVSYYTQNSLDGNLVDTSTYKFTIGSDYLSRYYFDGAIDEVKVYNEAFDEQTIYNNYENDITVLDLSMDEGTGLAIKDATGNVADGVINGANWGGGISGNALIFDGTDDYVDLGISGTLDLTSSRTISAWIKPDANGDYNTIVAKNIWKYSLFVYNGHLRGYIAGSISPASSVSSTALITPGEWQHVAMTFDYEGDKKVRLYVNGREVAYSTQTTMVGFPVTTSMYKFTIGSDYLSRYYFNGAIDEVKLFNGAFSPDAIDSIYHEY